MDASASAKMAPVAAAFVITGPSGVGKGTLIRALRERIPELELSTSATTRTPRAGEADGVDYHFLGAEDFERRVEAGDFLEHAVYSGNRYGTLRSEVEERTARGAPVLLEIEVQGARQVRESMPEAIQIFIAPPDAADSAPPPRGPWHRLSRDDRGPPAGRRGGTRRPGRVPPRGRQRRCRAAAAEPSGS